VQEAFLTTLMPVDFLVVVEFQVVKSISPYRIIPAGITEICRAGDGKNSGGSNHGSGNFLNG